MQEQTNSFWEKISEWTRNSLTLKVITIGVIILIMLIPISMVENLIEERQSRMQDAIIDINSKWAGDQIITPIVLTIPFREKKEIHNSKEETEIVYVKRYAHFLPEHLAIDGIIKPIIRHRGIYKVPVYSSDLNLKGSFTKPDFEKWKIDANNIIWEEAVISSGIQDLRGIKNGFNIIWNGKEYASEPVNSDIKSVKSGLIASVKAGESIQNYSFDVNFSLNGSATMQFILVGKETRIQLRSSWKDPSFFGSFLPDPYEIKEDGFEANWRVFHLNRPFPQQFLDKVEFGNSEFGVELKMPLNEYAKTNRSVKYATLFIALIFIFFLIAQMKYGSRVHFIQYLIVGFAICIFYTFLLSLSEHLSFSISYLIASVTIISMITAYADRILLKRAMSMLVFLTQSGLFLYIYVIIHMQDFALLAGAAGLLITLAILMYFTKDILKSKNHFES